MSSETLVIRLEIRLDGDSLTGSAYDGAAERTFSGWLGLVAAIDALVQSGASRTVAGSAGDVSEPSRPERKDSR
jgi:hypothetical protein